VVPTGAAGPKLMRSRSSWALAVTDSVPVGLYALRITAAGEKEFLFVSRRLLEMLQLSREEVLAQESLVRDRIHPQDRDSFEQQMLESIDIGVPLHWEGRLLIDGAVTWARIESMPQPQSDGSCVWQGVMSDITALKQKELDLQRLLDNAPIAIAVNSLTDADPAITYLNRQFVRTLGYDRATIPRLSDWSRLAYPDAAYRAEIMGRWAVALERARQEAGTVETIEAQVTAADGRRRDVVFSAVVLQEQLVISMLDVTERRQAERQLQQARLELAETALAITEAIPLGTYTMLQAPDGGLASFVFMSERFLEICGLEREAAAADPLNAFACVHPDDYDAWLARNAAVFATKSPFYGETRIVVEGKVRWISAESIPRQLPDGSTVWEGVLIDITERIVTQQRLQDNEARLRRILDYLPIPIISSRTVDGPEQPFVNRLFTSTFGYTPEQVATQDDWFRRAYPDADQRRAHWLQWHEDLAQASRSGGLVVPREYAVTCHDGRVKDVLISALLLEDQVVVALVDISERNRAEQQLRQERAQLALTLESLLDPHITLEPQRDAAGRPVEFLCRDANLAAGSDLQQPQDQLLARPLAELLPADPAIDLFERCAVVLESGEPLALNEVPFQRGAMGRQGWWDLRVVRVGEDLSCTWRDVSDRVEASRRLAASEQQYRLLADNSSDVVMQLAEDGTTRWVSPSLTAMLGWQPAEWIGRLGTEFLEHRGDADQYRVNQERLRAGHTIVARDRVRAKTGQWHWTETHASPFRDANGDIDGIVASFRTIDAEVKAEQELARMARTDELTGLLNRREVLARIDSSTGPAPRSGQHTAALFCDLDAFKPINDRHGHAAGDALLRVLAERIRGCLRSQDLAARLGGDELLVVLQGVRDLDSAVAIAETIRVAALAPVATPAGELQISLSIGVTLALPGESSDALIARADAAMYEAKRVGRNRVIPIPAPEAITGP
jgi:diguanylate cyclase (GGDEF)-like protein/PAS domain S-box-containing protein